MLIQQREHNGRGAFYIKENGAFLAEMTYYFPAQGIMLIDHTEVDDSLQGKNIGNQLVHHGVEYARSKHMKIVPECPFVKDIFEKTHEYDDVKK
jgi:predicted GNAT family acetyltransferase